MNEGLFVHRNIGIGLPSVGNDPELPVFFSAAQVKDKMVFSNTIDKGLKFGKIYFPLGKDIRGDDYMTGPGIQV